MLKPATLLSRTLAVSQQALHSGALQPIPTTPHFLEDRGIPFVVWMRAGLDKKVGSSNWQPSSPKRQPPQTNPFLPYDPRLFVADVSATHVCLLNKFPVYPHHLLMVTRTFEHQESYLTLPDFAAIWSGLAEIDGLAFYNGGKVAGASQPHKHLQLTPPPLSPFSAATPIEPFWDLLEPYGMIGATTLFPFLHAIVRLDPSLSQTPPQAAYSSYACYQRLLAYTRLAANPDNPTQQTGPYNLLFTRRWMLLAPRTQETYAEISVNALGFAGSLYVRDQAQFNLLKTIGPLTLLQNVAVPLGSVKRNGIPLYS